MMTFKARTTTLYARRDHNIALSQLLFSAKRVHNTHTPLGRENLVHSRDRTFVPTSCYDKHARTSVLQA